MIKNFISILIIWAFPLLAAEPGLSVTTHHIVLNGKQINYTATAGMINLADDKSNPKASLFYVSYIKEAESNETRPLTFCFNGGPGAASVWLHLGMLGPKKVALDPEHFTPAPYHIVDNPYSLLDKTDFVFIDPVSTGYSRTAQGEDPKQFHGVEEDIKSIAQFIQLFTTRHNRWDSPKYLIGESYGTARASGLASHLLEEYKLYLNGIVLISSILDFQTIDFDDSNLLSYILFLPSYTAAAWYHGKLNPDLQKDLPQALKQAESFALNEYALALLQGDALSEEKVERIASELARLTALPVNEIKKAGLKVPMYQFSKQLFEDQKKLLGRFDSRLLGFACDACGNSFNYDPSITAIFGAFTGAFMDYVRKDLKWEGDDQYKVLTSVRPWNYGNASNCYLNMTTNLKESMIKNPLLRVFVASGYYDLATPYFGTIYTFNHLGLNPSLRNNITMRFFEAGHMMYTHPPSLEKLKRELAEFYDSGVTKAQ